MSRYQPFYQEDAEAFLRLYQKYLDHQYITMKHVFESLPTDAIERVFDDKDIHKKEDELFIEFGFKHIVEIAQSLEYVYSLYLEGRLTEVLGKKGAKINEKKIGIRKR